MSQLKNIVSLLILANLSKGLEQDLELCCIPMAESIRDNGQLTINMEKAIRNFKMGQFTKGHMSMVNLKDMEYIHGRMVRLIRASG